MRASTRLFACASISPSSLSFLHLAGRVVTKAGNPDEGAANQTHRVSYPTREPRSILQHIPLDLTFVFAIVSRSQLLFDNTFHLGTGVMFPEFMLYNLEMESDERVVDIKVSEPFRFLCIALYPSSYMLLRSGS